MSAVNRVGRATQNSAAVGNGNPLVFDPLAGFPLHPFFQRKLRFVQAFDSAGRIRLAAFSPDDDESCC